MSSMHCSLNLNRALMCNCDVCYLKKTTHSTGDNGIFFNPLNKIYVKDKALTWRTTKQTHTHTHTQNKQTNKKNNQQVNED